MIIYMSDRRKYYYSMLTGNNAVSLVKSTDFYWTFWSILTFVPFFGGGSGNFFLTPLNIRVKMYYISHS